MGWKSHWKEKDIRFLPFVSIKVRSKVPFVLDTEICTLHSLFMSLSCFMMFLIRLPLRP
jgi:hypothetical protein